MDGKDHDLIAGAIKQARDYVPSDKESQAIVDEVAWHIGKALAGRSRRRQWKQSRWEEAAGVRRPRA